MKKISHSAFTKYDTCGALYENHYVKRLRTVGNSSALLFGGCIDDALNAALLKTGDPIEVFRDTFTWDAAKNCTWLKNDLDIDLFNRDDLKKILGQSIEYITWACMRKKGRIMLQGYIDKVLPLVEEVHGVQLETRDRPGFVDAVLTLRGHGMVLIDNKTTSQYYKRSSVRESTQLALYASQLEISKVGFITLSKRIPKTKSCSICGHDGTGKRFQTCNSTDDGVRCGGSWAILPAEVGDIQILVDDVSQEQMTLINNEIDNAETLIKKKEFPQNRSACDKMFGKPCPYYNYCRTGDTNGLVKKKEGER